MRQQVPGRGFARVVLAISIAANLYVGFQQTLLWGIPNLLAAVVLVLCWRQFERTRYP